LPISRRTTFYSLLISWRTSVRFGSDDSGTPSTLTGANKPAVKSSRSMVMAIVGFPTINRKAFLRIPTFLIHAP